VNLTPAPRGLDQPVGPWAAARSRVFLDPDLEHAQLVEDDPLAGQQLLLHRLEDGRRSCCGPSARWARPGAGATSPTRFHLPSEGTPFRTSVPKRGGWGSRAKPSRPALMEARQRVHEAGAALLAHGHGGTQGLRQLVQLDLGPSIAPVPLPVPSPYAPVHRA